MKNVIIVARLWYDRLNGQEYNGGRVYVNGDLVAEFNMSWGGEGMAKQRALQTLQDAGWIPENVNPTIWMLDRRIPIHLESAYGPQRDIPKETHIFKYKTS